MQFKTGNEFALTLKTIFRYAFKTGDQYIFALS